MQSIVTYVDMLAVLVGVLSTLRASSFLHVRCWKASSSAAYLIRTVTSSVCRPSCSALPRA